MGVNNRQSDVESNKKSDDAGTTEPKSWFSPRMRLAVMFTASELIVIVSALGYTFFLFPLYAALESDIYKALWRILLHPVWFEITMILPQRLISLKELRNVGVWRFIPVLHSLV